MISDRDADDGNATGDKGRLQDGTFLRLQPSPLMDEVCDEA